jgi:predicted TIM-barrel fold metal-dependent hydrolase
MTGLESRVFGVYGDDTVVYPGHGDPAEAMRRILDINSHALVVGTDLPSTRAPLPFSDDDLTSLADFLDPQELEDTLWNNAAALYRLAR